MISVVAGRTKTSVVPGRKRVRPFCTVGEVVRTMDLASFLVT